MLGDILHHEADAVFQLFNTPEKQTLFDAGFDDAMASNDQASQDKRYLEGYELAISMKGK